MGGCQNYGPLLGPLNTRGRILPRTQKGGSGSASRRPLSQRAAAEERLEGPRTPRMKRVQMCIHIHIYI